MIMKTCHFYYFIEPLSEEYRDDEEHNPQVTVEIQTKRKVFVLSIFGENNRILMLRVSVPGLDEEEVPDDDLRYVQLIKEHAASTLRFTYDQQVELHPLNVWMYEEEGKPYRMSVSLAETLNETFELNYDNVKASFVGGFPLRNELRLLSDGVNHRVPLQFRMLSLYKLLELRFKVRGKWTAAYSVFMDRFESEYHELKLSELKLQAYIEDLRNRCAHVKSMKEVIGVTSLSNKDALEVEGVLPLLVRLA